MNNKMLWTTNVGSHIWRMNRPDSDIDTFTVYIIPTKDLLSSKNRGGGSHFSDKNTTGNEDKSSHEIGKVIDELIKGNINFLVGTLSPLVLYQHNDYLLRLKNIVFKYSQTKSCVHSIRGLAIHNYKKYVVGSDTARDYPLTKKCNLINRTLLFGINILNGNGFKFEPVKNQTPEDVKEMLFKLDEAADLSLLPETTNPEPFREYLYNIRLDELNSKL